MKPESCCPLVKALKERARTYAWDSNVFYASDAELMRKAAEEISRLVALQPARRSMTTEPRASLVERLGKAEKPLAYTHVRLDLRRDTKLFVTRNVSGHVHVTLGKSEAALILHPHAAVRLIADLQAVLTGADYAFD